jgi:hypothetical protein
MRLKNIRKIVLSAILMLIISMLSVFVNSLAAAQGRTYYVATNGNDSNPGTLDRPWRTIQHGADTVAAGETVQVRNGVYNEQVIISNSGNAESGYISFSAYPNETPIVDGTEITTGNNGIVVDGSYIKISGFEIRNWQDTGICSWNAGYLEISNCKIHNVGGGIGLFSGTHDFTVTRVEMYQVVNGGFDASPADGPACYNGVISDCVTHDAADPEQNTDGFGLGHTLEGHNFVFNRCEAYNVWDGFDISAHDVQLNSCSSHDNTNTGYKLWDDGITLTNCLGYNNEANNLQLTWNEKLGTVTLQNCDFLNNLSTDNIWIQNPARHLHMYNCIMAGGENVGLDFEQWGPDTYRGDYNIFNCNNPDRTIVVRDHEPEFSLDMIAAGDWNQFSGQDAHFIAWNSSASQLFNNIAKGDFTLRQGSAAIDAGTATNAPNVDYAGSSRPQGAGYDIGAYEYGSSPSPTTLAPSTSTPSSSSAEALGSNYNIVIITAAIVAVVAIAAATIIILKRRNNYPSDNSKLRLK